jgi:hypothetical protein
LSGAKLTELKEANSCASLGVGWVKIFPNCQTWWHMPTIPAVGRLRQEDGESRASLGYITRPCFKQTPPSKKNHTVWNPVESSSEQTLVSDEVKSNVEVLKNC